MPRAQQVVVWGLLGTTGAVLLRRAWLKLFGPVLFYDLVRLARRSRYALMRCLYAVFLFCMLLLVHALHVDQHIARSVDAREMAAFAESFFFAFVGVQYLVVCLLTPAYTASAIAEEREHKTLDFLLATDLHNREIVLSKQVARLANMTLLILTGLPILALLQFLGGVEPGLLLAAFAATGLTTLGLGSLSIVCSVYNRKPRNAIVLTYLTMAAYLAISGVLSLAHLAAPSVTGQALTWAEDPVTIQDLIDWFSVANPIVLLIKLEQVPALADVVPDLLRNYALFYGAFTALCTGWAILRLRVVALKQASGKVNRHSWGARRRRRRPYEGDQPMVWKEVTLDPGLQFNWIGRIAILLLILVSFIPPVWIAVYYLDDTGIRSWGMNPEFFQQSINIWVRTVGTIVACLTLLGVAVRASSGISGERDRQTFDSLLTTSLDSDDLLYGKWLGGIMSVRWGWIWLLLIWGLGVVTGGVHVAALPLLVVAWAVYAGFLSYLGLFFSMFCRTTMRATITTLGVTLCLAGGHWLLWSCCLPLLGPGSRSLDHVAMFQAFALTPPATLGFLAFHGAEFEHGAREAVEIMVDCVLGLVVWGVGVLMLWGMTSQRLRQVTGRQLVRNRELSPPAIVDQESSLSD
jgi:ABC-type transport system involved in multi-copper enzyme maturation permease subunit